MFDLESLPFSFPFSFPSSYVSPRRILVIGDSMLDIWKHGRIDERGQEGCDKFVTHEIFHTPGGAANAAHQLATWPNVKVDLISNLGRDNIWGYKYGGIAFTKGSIPHKCRYLVDDRNVFRSDQENINYGLSETEIHSMRLSALMTFNHIAPDIHGVLISDYDKGFLDRDLIHGVIDTCHRLDIPCVVDAKRPPDLYWASSKSSLHRVVLKCNEAYMRRYAYMLDQVNPPFVVTHGSGVPTISTKKSVLPVEHPNTPISCLNHVGAGDSFAAHLVLALSHDIPLAEAAIFAHSAGRMFVQHRHSRPPYSHEIRKDMYGKNAKGKILNRDQAKILKSSIDVRDDGKGEIRKVIFTNGVFRLPHAGHSWLINWAKDQSPDSILIVGINTDESARRIRGPHTDFTLPLEERMYQIASLESVDWVIPFGESEDDPVELMRELKPDILVKGPEYVREKDGEKPPGWDIAGELRIPGGSPFPAHATHVIDAIREKGER